MIRAAALSLALALIALPLPALAQFEPSREEWRQFTDGETDAYTVFERDGQQVFLALFRCGPNFVLTLRLPDGVLDTKLTGSGKVAIALETGGDRRIWKTQSDDVRQNPNGQVVFFSFNDPAFSTEFAAASEFKLQLGGALTYAFSARGSANAIRSVRDSC